MEIIATFVVVAMGIPLAVLTLLALAHFVKDCGKLAIILFKELIN